MTLTAPVARCRWSLLPETPHERDRLSSALSLHPITAQLLVNRGVTEIDHGSRVLQPTLAELPDPSRLPDFGAAIEALDRALEQGHPILVHGDYDVDGMCGSVLLKRLIELLGGKVGVFLPDRVRDGYSFGPRSLEAVRDSGSRLVIAVDNGTTALEPLRAMADAGVEVLVVDHHLAGAELPPCTALLNPWVAQDQDDPIFPHFSGTGVAYLLAWGYLRHRHGDGSLPEHHRRFLYDALGFVAIATIADAMRLEGPNRGLVRRGLETLPNSSFAGLRALCEMLNLKQPTATDVGFRIGPHLNAAGRMGCTEIAFDLLAAHDPQEARKLAERLRDLNRERQDLQRREADALLPQIEAQRERGDRVLFAGRDAAAFGVLGVVAARFHEETGLPTLLWGGCDGGVARGSARGPASVHLVELMDRVAPHLAGHGGHAQAAGFHFDPTEADRLAAALREAAQDLPEPQPPSLRVDLEVQPQDLDLAVLDELNLLEPFGQAFELPRFLATDMQLVAPPQFLGAEARHLALRLGKHGQVVRTLAWNQADRLGHLPAGQSVDVVFEPSINTFRGRRSVEWILRDLRPASSS
ncbi:MAG: single-stranded-DNA-specific exonuclease RecJ [Planctomycetes bacterium]|nr:single-stranded-DNA-specific exonuclease RecJ [Planctomycetota bacterium]